MGRKKLEEAGPPGSAARLRVELTAADWIISIITWGSAAGVIVWSMLNATPYVRAHVTPGWEDTAFVLPVVVDLAFVGSLRADEIASRYGASGGFWAGALRLFTGAASLFLNVGHSWEKGDWTGVFQHLIAPGILVLVAEAGPAYRRRLADRLTTVEEEEEEKAGKKAQEDAAETERLRLVAQEEADRQAEKDRQEDERQRLQRLADEDRDRRRKAEDDERALNLEERREAARAARALEARRLELEDKRLTATIPAPHSTTDGTTADRQNGTTVHRHNGMTAPAAAAPAAPARMPAALVAPQTDPRTTATQATTQRPAPAHAAAHAAPTRVTARVDEDQEQPTAAPKPPAGPVKDWDLPGLPDDVRPGVDPIMLTDPQAHARIRYGHNQGWSQRRVATFSGRSPSTVHKHMKALDAE